MQIDVIMYFWMGLGGMFWLQRMWLVDLDLRLKSSHLSNRSGRTFCSKFKADAPFEIRGV
ncbi:MAG: hypothetical protein RMI63_06140 [Caldimicrobium sp.]|nr:hypothetical protein [Caldimicrobium sp.]